MKPNSRRISWRCLLCLIISLLCILQFQTCLGGSNNENEEAYVTLLYGDEFLLGVRVLGKSIRDTRSNKDMVVLVSDGVSYFAKNLLRVSILSLSFFFLKVFLFYLFYFFYGFCLCLVG